MKITEGRMSKSATTSKLFTFICKLVVVIISVTTIVSCGDNLSPHNSPDPLDENQGDAQVADQCGSMNQLECEMFQTINSIRQSNGIASLDISQKCVAAAQSHAKDMDRNNYFSHDGLAETWEQRMSRFEITGIAGENIALSSGVGITANLWMNSPGHRSNILDPSYTNTGIGHSNGLWVQCFTGN